MKDNYYDDIIDTIKIIIDKMNEKNIDFILEQYTGIISEKRKKLIKKFLIGKVNLMQEQFKF